MAFNFSNFETDEERPVEEVLKPLGFADHSSILPIDDFMINEDSLFNVGTRKVPVARADLSELAKEANIEY
jgi:hypothetical protein